VRSFCARRSARKSRHTSGDLARRRLHQRIRHLQALQYLDHPCFLEEMERRGLAPLLDPTPAIK